MRKISTLFLLLLSMNLWSLQAHTAHNLHAWGHNSHGQLGDGTITNKYSPIQISSSTNWASVSSGAHHTTAIKTDGTLWTWGNNERGQLGDGTTTNKNRPIQVDVSSNWSSVDAGGHHVIATKTDGTLWAWGHNLSGQLGDGTTTDKHSPTQIGSAPNWTSVVTGSNFSLALLTDKSTDLPTLAHPQQYSYSGINILVDFSLPETAKAGTVQLTFNQTGGATDPSSPHIVTFDATFEAAGQHTAMLNGGSLNSSTGVTSVSSAPYDSLVNGAIYTVTISYQDEAGNPAASDANTDFTYDVAPPIVEIFPSETNPTNNTTIPITMLFSEEVFDFTAADIVLGNATLSNLQNGGNSIFTADLTPSADGIVTVDIGANIAIDLAGNGNMPAIQFSITYDGTAPTVPAKPSLASTSDTGISNMDGITIDNTPELHGTAEANATVAVYINDVVTATTTADGSGNWSYTIAEANTLADGTYQVKVTATDAAGNESVISEALTITIDNQAPTLLTKNISIGLDATGNAVIAPQDIDNGSTDNVSSAANLHLSLSRTAFECADKGQTLEVTLSVTDEAGNSATGIATVTVEDNIAPAIQAGQVFAIDENSAAGSAVGAIIATDNCSIESFSISAGNTGDAFAVDAAGALTVNNVAALNYETSPEFTLTITTADGAGNNSPQTVSISLNNLNDNAPVIAASQSFRIDENTAAGTTIGTVSASDADGATTFSNWTIVSGNEAGGFTIDASTGVITVADASVLDYEITISFTLALSVSDGLNTSTTEQVVVDLNNLNDNAPVANNATVAIDENTVAGSSIHTVVATDADGDELSYSIITGNTGSAFAIDAVTGAVSVADVSQLDYEAVQQFTLTIEVSDGTNTTNASITVNLNNLNDNAPIPHNATTAIDENSPIGSTVHSITASDTDGDELSYSITTGNGSGAFATNSSTGAMTVADVSQLDYEAVQQYVLTVAVSDGVNSEQATIIINLSNLNDNAPVVTASQSFRIDENTAAGTTLGTVSASDADGATTYSNWTIVSGNEAGGFAIDVSSGAITVADASVLDFETTTSFTLAVSVSDGVNTSTTEQVVINLNNLNDNAPVANNATVSVDENSVNGTAVHTIAASDADGGALTFSIEAGNTGSAFAIDAATGAITVADVSLLDYEAIPQFVLVVKASDGTNTDFAYITIDLNNLNDNAPVIAAISDVAGNEVALISFTATATDADNMGKLQYSLAEGAPAGASIDATTGAFKWTPREEQGPASYTTSVIVSDGELSSMQEVTITVNEVNQVPVFTSIPIASAREGEAYTYQLTATDADLPANTLTYEAVEIPSWLRFDAATQTLSGTPVKTAEVSNLIRLQVSDGQEISTQEFTLEVEITTGLFDKEKQEHMLVYPNPTKGRLIIELDNIPAEEKVTISLLSLEGRLLIQKQGTLQNGAESISAYLQEAKMGTYLLQVKAKNSLKSIKVIKE